jgi:hypothetical protein
MIMRELETYRDLLNFLKECEKNGTYLDQKIQIVGLQSDKRESKNIEVLVPGISIGRVGDYEFEGARSCVDNKYNPDDLVIYTDDNQFDIEGADSLYHIGEGLMMPGYSHGLTSLEDQLNPVVIILLDK